ncbi:MAG: energy transducer TonB [Bacteroidota bacterium]
MKRNFIVLLLVMFSVNFYSQENIDTQDNNVYSSAGLDVMPKFRGGNKGFVEFISKNYKLPNVKGLKGRLLVEFVVEKDGSLSDIKVIKDLGFGTAEEAIRVLKLSPLWLPGMQNGRNVRTKFMLPLMLEVKEK